jgi:sugar phosphate isomerase/epimerase
MDRRARGLSLHRRLRRTAGREPRAAAACGRAGRAGGAASTSRKSLNREPEHAEVRYLAHNLEECREYFGRIQSPSLGWAFTVNHAHLVPEGIDGFLDAMDLARCGEVRVADSHGRYEEHLRPGEGSIDFKRMFARIEGGGYRGHYMMAFGTLDDMLKGRDTLVRAAGV